MIQKRRLAARPVALFKILSDEKRYQAIRLFVRLKRPQTVAEISEELKMSHSGASHLLGILHQNDIVSFEKRGRETYYSLASSVQARKIVKLVRAV